MNFAHDEFCSNATLRFHILTHRIDVCAAQPICLKKCERQHIRVLRDCRSYTYTVAIIYTCKCCRQNERVAQCCGANGKQIEKEREKVVVVSLFQANTDKSMCASVLRIANVIANLMKHESRICVQQYNTNAILWLGSFVRRNCQCVMSLFSVRVSFQHKPLQRKRDT